MIDTVIIDAMVASGCSPEQIAAVVKACSHSEQAKVDARREKDRLRKKAARRQEEQGECPQEFPDVQGGLRTEVESSGQSGNGFSLSPIPLLSPTPPNNPLTPKPSSKNNLTRAHRLPEYWTLSQADIAYSVSKGLTEPESRGLAELFASWAWSASGTNAKKVDWHQAWRGWVQRDGPKIIAGRRSSSGKPFTEHQRKQRETQDILDAMDKFTPGRNDGRTPNLELLPKHSGERPQGVRSGFD